MAFGCFYLVGQGHHDPKGDVLVLLHIGIDNVSDEQVEEEEAGEAGGDAER